MFHVHISDAQKLAAQPAAAAPTADAPHAAAAAASTATDEIAFAAGNPSVELLRGCVRVFREHGQPVQSAPRFAEPPQPSTLGVQLPDMPAAKPEPKPEPAATKPATVGGGEVSGIKPKSFTINGAYDIVEMDRMRSSGASVLADQPL